MNEASRHPLVMVARRIMQGIHPQLAIKDHIDAWNRERDPALYLEEPPLTGRPHYDVWLAGAAEYEAFLIDRPPPDWSQDPSRFLDRPVFAGTASSRAAYLADTPFAWRRRNLFIGATMIGNPMGQNDR